MASAQKLTEDLNAVLERGGFSVKGWVSNKVVTKVENREREFRIYQEEVEEKVLAMVWNFATDEFSFKIKLGF